MPYIPIFSRVNFKEFLFIVLSAVILIFEKLIRVFQTAFPSLAGILGRFIFKLASADLSCSTVHPVAKMLHIREMVSYWGFPFEEHIVLSDSYYLGLHRIPHPPLERLVNDNSSLNSSTQKLNGKGSSFSFTENGNVPSSSKSRRATHKPSTSRPAVLLGHGFMMCSEVWVCSKHNSLALMLSEEGYDVWMMNARGNKYSFKHKVYSPYSIEFWNFSLDEYAQDLVNVVDYILDQTNQTSLIYIGFSQGTAQLFSALSAYPKLNRKIRLACCLAPTGKPKNLRNSFVTSLIKSTPNVLFLIFGRKSALSSVHFLTQFFAPKTWVHLIDFSLRFLFDWKCTQLSLEDKITCYRHLYSTTSVKSIVHWFQIIRSSTFAMYDDAPGIGKLMSLTHVPPSYPIENIATRLALFYGQSDTLSDVHFLLDSLHPVYTLGVPKYEHLDCLWASNAHRVLFPAVLGVLRKFGGKHPDGTKAPVPPPYFEKELVDQVMMSGIMASNIELSDQEEIPEFPFPNGPVDRRTNKNIHRGHGSSMDNQRVASKTNMYKGLF